MVALLFLPRHNLFNTHKNGIGFIKQIFWGMVCFLFPGTLAFDFCYDLDIWGQGQALRAFFVVMSFSLFYQKYEGEFDQTWQEAS